MQNANTHFYINIEKNEQSLGCFMFLTGIVLKKHVYDRDYRLMGAPVVPLLPVIIL